MTWSVYLRDDIVVETRLVNAKITGRGYTIDLKITVNNLDASKFRKTLANPAAEIGDAKVTGGNNLSIGTNTIFVEPPVGYESFEEGEYTVADWKIIEKTDLYYEVQITIDNTPTFEVGPVTTIPEGVGIPVFESTFTKATADANVTTMERREPTNQVDGEGVRTDADGLSLIGTGIIAKSASVSTSVVSADTLGATRKATGFPDPTTATASSLEVTPDTVDAVVGGEIVYRLNEGSGSSINNAASTTDATVRASTFNWNLNDPSGSGNDVSLTVSDDGGVDRNQDFTMDSTFTIDFYMRFEGGGSLHYVFNAGNSSSTSFRAFTNGGANTDLLVRNQWGPDFEVPNVQTGDWVRVTLVFDADSSTATAYRNGTQVDSADYKNSTGLSLDAFSFRGPGRKSGSSTLVSYDQYEWKNGAIHP